jgi:hypothetical protein
MGGSHDFKLLHKETDIKEKTLIYRVLHTGIPLEITARLLGSENKKDTWLTAREISQGEFELRFTPLENNIDHDRNLLEIWDKHRLFKLATINR